MFAKIFAQILDSSIAENPELRFTFMDFLLLATSDGIVDMTHEAIARRTNRAIEIVRSTIAVLEAPDPLSRNAEHGGARIKRLDEHRDWGWLIINYDYFRKIASEEQRRARTRARVRKFRVTHGNTDKTDSPRKTEPISNAPKQAGNAGNAMQKKKQRHEEPCSQAHKEFIEKWTVAYKEHFSEDYAFQGGKDAKAVKLLLASSKKTPDELMRVARAAWKHAQGFYSKGAVSICGFNAKFNEIRQELNNARDKKPTPESGRGLGTANEGKSSQYAGVGRLRSVPDA
jgi:hypothetical protein